eukprot:350391-Chlamydomonas_euryale.AAC.8
MKAARPRAGPPGTRSAGTYAASYAIILFCIAATVGLAYMSMRVRQLPPTGAPVSCAGKRGDHADARTACMRLCVHVAWHAALTCAQKRQRATTAAKKPTAAASMVAAGSNKPQRLYSSSGSTI